MVGQGSPPRMRGKGIGTSNVSVGNRITPAYAGKSFPVNLVSRQLQDHPRVCGEKTVFRTNGPTTEGSPPRMRGKVALLLPRAGCGGITPAYAGKRAKPGTRPDRSRDHPRVCGEKTTSTCLAGALQGSPPRMRGKEPVNPYGGMGTGITPAYAGKSRRCWCSCCRRQDHPRVCGEKLRW